MSYIIKRAARKLAESTLQRMYEIAVDKMVERGFEPTSVKKIGGEIKFEVDKDELTGYEVEDIKADTLEEFMEKRIDGEIDQPRYQYDEDFEEGLQQELMADGYQAIDPGTHAVSYTHLTLPTNREV